MVESARPLKSGVLIVGLGQIGMGYDLALEPSEFVYSHARAFSQHPDFELLCGVDPDARRRESFTALYGPPAYGELREALSKHAPQVIVVAVPTAVHGETLRLVLEHSSPRVVLCEKPLAYDEDEARQIVASCTGHGVSLYVNYMRRSDLGAIEIRERLERGAIGSPVKGVVWYSKGFLHNGSHFFNLLEYWLGAARRGRILDGGRALGAGDREPDLEVTYDRGTVVFLAAWEEHFSHYTVELLSPTGRLRYEQGGRRIEWQSVRQDANLPTYSVLDPVPEQITSGMNRYQWHVAEQLSRALAGRDAHLCTGADALRTLITMKRILKQASI